MCITVDFVDKVDYASQESPSSLVVEVAIL